MSKKFDIGHVKNLVYNIAGYTLLDDIYVNNRTKMTAIDDFGYKYYFTLDNLKFTGSARMVDKSNPYSIDNIRLWLINNDFPYELLSTEYKGNGSKNRKEELLKFQCENGHIFFRTWNDICTRGMRCEDCHKRFSNHEEFISYIKEKYGDEYEILGTYINSITKIKVRHNKCGNVFEIRAEHLANGHGCPNPVCCKKHGKDHYRYNPELTDDERLNDRDLSYEYRKWRMYVYKKYNFTCDVCGVYTSQENKICAHHLDSWDENYDKRYDISNGVSMCQNCHIDFHKRYGFGKNNIEQYIEYKNNYDNTEVINQIA